MTGQSLNNISKIIWENFLKNAVMIFLTCTKEKLSFGHYLDPKASLGEIFPEERLTMMFRTPFRKNPLAHQPQGNPTSSGE